VRIVRIFRLVLDDVKDLQAVETACGLSPWTLEGYESEVGREDCTAFIARTDSREAVGFMIGRVPLISGGVGEIFNIGILPDFRRHGLGNALLD
jgi:ribosomal protein S18 acetylase RimI-like enzyme